jgi:hypothetical protein
VAKEGAGSGSVNFLAPAVARDHLPVPKQVGLLQQMRVPRRARVHKGPDSKAL